MSDKNRIVFYFTLIALSFSINGFSQTAQQRKDSLSHVSGGSDDRHVPTSYLFDSLFVVSKNFLNKNIRLAKTMYSSKLILNQRDSTVFYSRTGRTVILNGKVLAPRGEYVFIDKCAAGNIDVLSQKILLKKYGINNANGGYAISCK